MIEPIPLTAEEIEEAAHGPDLEQIMEHFGYATVGEWYSTWLNKPGQIERLSFLPGFIERLGLDKRYRITFDYDPDYPNMLLQATCFRERMQTESTPKAEKPIAGGGKEVKRVG